MSDTWATSGVSGVGATDASVGDPERAERISDNVSRGFDVNENQVDMPKDITSHIGEPGVIPHAFKVAEARRLLKLAMSFDTLVEELTTCGRFGEIQHNVRGVLADLPHYKKTAAAGISAPVAPPKAPTLPKTSIKPMAAMDPRTDKPPGMNLMHGIQTVSNGADTGASYTSFSRRLQGSPV